MTITAIYAALLGLLFLALSVNVVRTRRATRVSLGAGDHPLLERRIRAHGNFAEYTPIALILIAFVPGPPHRLQFFGEASVLHQSAVAGEPGSVPGNVGFQAVHCPFSRAARRAGQQCGHFHLAGASAGPFRALGHVPCCGLGVF